MRTSLIQTDLLVDDVNMWVLCYSDGTTESIEELLGIHGEAELVVDNNGTGTIPATPDLDVDEDKHLEAVNRKLWADSAVSSTLDELTNPLRLYLKTSMLLPSHKVPLLLAPFRWRSSGRIVT